MPTSVPIGLYTDSCCPSYVTWSRHRFPSSIGTRKTLRPQILACPLGQMSDTVGHRPTVSSSGLSRTAPGSRPTTSGVSLDMWTTGADTLRTPSRTARFCHFFGTKSAKLEEPHGHKEPDLAQIWIDWPCGRRLPARTLQVDASAQTSPAAGSPDPAGGIPEDPDCMSPGWCTPPAGGVPVYPPRVHPCRRSRCRTSAARPAVPVAADGPPRHDPQIVAFWTTLGAGFRLTSRKQRVFWGPESARWPPQGAAIQTPNQGGLPWLPHVTESGDEVWRWPSRPPIGTPWPPRPRRAGTSRSRA